MKHIGMATLGRDAEIRYLPNGTAVAQLSLAVNYYDKNAEGNRATQWVNAALFGDRAQSLAQFLVKGSRHCFTLRDMHIRTYTRNDNTEGFSLDAIVDDVELGPRANGGNSEGGSAPAAAPRPQSQQRAPAPPAASKPRAGFDDMDDDIPF